MEKTMKPIDAVIGALDAGRFQEHMDGIRPFARELAARIADHESGTPDPDAVADGAALFLALRLSYHPQPDTGAARHETMGSIQDALRAMNYVLGLDGTGIDMHTPDAEGAYDALDSEEFEHLEASGFMEDGDVGMLQGAVWHAIVAHVVSGRMVVDTPETVHMLADKLRSAMAIRIGTGSFMLEEDGLDGLVRIAHALTGDIIDLTATQAIAARTDHLIEAFEVKEEAELAATFIAEHDIGGNPAFLKGATILSALSDADPVSCMNYLMELGRGSETGFPHAYHLDALSNLLEDPDALLADEDDEDHYDLHDAVATVLAGMTLVGRLPLMDPLRTRTLARLAVEELVQQQGLAEQEDARILEGIAGALRKHSRSVDEFLGWVEEMKTDEDAIRVRVTMRSANPARPPAKDDLVLPRAIMIRTGGEVDASALQHRVEAFFQVQEDAFRAFEPGDVYWRLSNDGENAYSATMGALATIAALPGVEEASVVMRDERGLGVTTLTGGMRPVHRRIADQQD